MANSKEHIKDGSKEPKKSVDNLAYEMGQRARAIGKPISSNPYNQIAGGKRHDSWKLGWESVKDSGKNTRRKERGTAYERCAGWDEVNNQLLKKARRKEGVAGPTLEKVAKKRAARKVKTATRINAVLDITSLVAGGPKVATLDLNQLAINVAKAEGGKVNLSIAQIKEVIRLTLVELKSYLTDPTAEKQAIERVVLQTIETVK